MANQQFSMLYANTENIKMNGSTRVVYQALTRHRRQDDGICWISQTKLARDLGYNRVTIWRAIKELIKLKLLAFANKWKFGRYKFYEVFQSVKKHLNRHTRRAFSRVASLQHQVLRKSNNISEHDQSIKEKIKRKSKNSKKVISKSQLNEITKKATESIAKNFRFMGNFDKIKNNEFVKTSIADKIRILSEAL